MPDDLESRVNKLEARLTSAVNSLNKVNQTTHDHVVALEKSFAKIDARLTTAVGELNKINRIAHDHIVKLEKSIAKVEKQSDAIQKVADPKIQERNMYKIAEMAVKANEKKKR